MILPACASQVSGRGGRDKRGKYHSRSTPPVRRHTFPECCEPSTLPWGNSCTPGSRRDCCGQFLNLFQAQLASGFRGFGERMAKTCSDRARLVTPGKSGIGGGVLLLTMLDSGRWTGARTARIAPGKEFGGAAKNYWVRESCCSCARSVGATYWRSLPEKHRRTKPGRESTS